MAFICFNCGKGVIKGTQHRHRPGVAGRQHLRRAPHTPKNFVPNLHSAFIIQNGRTEKVLLCTKCRRLLKKEGKIKVWSKDSAKQNLPVKNEVIKEKVQKIEKKVEEKEKVKPVEKKVVKKTRKKVEPVVPAMSIEDLVGKKK